MTSDAHSVEEYIQSLPVSRQSDVSHLRKIILKNLPKGYEEVMQYGMISYVVPFTIFPDTYNHQPLAYVSLASQKNYISLYLTNIYGDNEAAQWFHDEWKKSGKKKNIGKSCVRFTSLDEIPLDLIEKTVARTSVQEYIEMYKKSRNVKG